MATGVTRENDPEWLERVRLHKERRPSTWVTYESYQNIAAYFQQTNFQTYLLDSATMLTTNKLFELLEEMNPEGSDDLDQMLLSEKQLLTIFKLLEAEWAKILDAISSKEADVWIVSDEIGLGIVPDTKLGRVFRDFQGKINQMIAKEASETYFIIAGLAQKIK